MTPFEMVETMFEFYKSKLVAVTGGTGLNGSYIVKALAEAGARVRAITHKRPANAFTKLAEEVVKANLIESESTAEAIRGGSLCGSEGPAS